KYQRGVRHQHLGVQVLAVTLEPFVFLHLEHHYNVPTRAAARAGVPHPAKRHVLTRGYSGRYLDGNLAIPTDPALAPALTARARDPCSLPGTGRARRNAHELAEEGTLGATLLTAAAARATPLRRAT